VYHVLTVVSALTVIWTLTNPTGDDTKIYKCIIFDSVKEGRQVWRDGGGLEAERERERE
jgi:hypothetical protein